MFLTQTNDRFPLDKGLHSKLICWPTKRLFGKPTVPHPDCRDQEKCRIAVVISGCRAIANSERETAMNCVRQLLSKSLRVILCALFAGLLAASALAQVAATNGSISGTVTDNTGAVVPDATVTVSNPSKNFTRDTKTDSGGEFAVRELPPGTYTLTINKQGFKKAEYPDVQVNVGTTAQLRATLSVGQTTETVEVTGEQLAAVDTEKTSISDVIQPIQMQQLPLNQRSFTSMVTQQPGIVSLSNTSNNAGESPTSVTWAQGSQISANGQVSSNMAYLIDGVNFGNSGFGAPGTAAGGDVPGVEGIQEFQVLSANYSAAYGGSAGAVVSFATKSGTNNWHGSLYEYLRNDKVDAESYFDTGKFPYHRNQFGGTIGGPIVKDRTFFFANYEGLQQAYTTTSIGNVPSLCARNGGVGGSGVGCPGGIPFLVTNNYAPGGPVPVAIPAATKAEFVNYPLPNGTDYGNGIAQLLFPNSQPISQQYGLIRIDQYLSKNDTLTGRYTITDATGSNAYQVPTYAFDKYDRLQNFMLKWTHTMGSNKVNTLAFGYNRSLLKAVVSPTVPIPSDAYTGNPSRQVVGTISVGSATSGNTSGALSTVGIDNWGPFKGADSSWPITDDFEWTVGRHSIKIGGGFGWRQWNWHKGNLIGGGWTFNSLNDLLAGQVGVLIIRVDTAVAQWNVSTHPVGMYVEDTWKATRKLTINAGLRWDFQYPIMTNEQLFGNVRSNQDYRPDDRQHAVQELFLEAGAAAHRFGVGPLRQRQDRIARRRRHLLQLRRLRTGGRRTVVQRSVFNYQLVLWRAGRSPIPDPLEPVHGRHAAYRLPGAFDCRYQRQSS